MPRLRYLIATALFFAACACSNGPAPSKSPHPPVSDLRVWAHNDLLAPAGACVAEPPAPDPDAPSTTAADLHAWQIEILLSGRGCRDTVARICAWYRDNGAADVAPYCPAR